MSDRVPAPAPMPASELPPKARVLAASLANTLLISNGEARHRKPVTTTDACNLLATQQMHHVPCAVIVASLYAFIADPQPTVFLEFLKMTRFFYTSIYHRNISRGTASKLAHTGRTLSDDHPQVQLVLAAIRKQLMEYSKTAWRDEPATRAAADACIDIIDAIAPIPVPTVSDNKLANSTLSAGMGIVHRSRDCDALPVLVAAIATKESADGRPLSRSTGGRRVLKRSRGDDVDDWRSTKKIRADDGSAVASAAPTTAPRPARVFSPADGPPGVETAMFAYSYKEVIKTIMHVDRSATYNVTRNVRQRRVGPHGTRMVAMFGDVQVLTMTSLITWHEAVAAAHGVPSRLSVSELRTAMRSPMHERAEATLAGVLDMLATSKDNDEARITRGIAKYSSKDRGTHVWEDAYRRGVYGALAYLDVDEKLAARVFTAFVGCDGDSDGDSTSVPEVQALANELPYFYTTLARNVARAAVRVLTRAKAVANSTLGILDDAKSAAVLKIVVYMQMQVVEPAAAARGKSGCVRAKQDDMTDVLALIGGTIELLGACPMFREDGKVIADMKAGTAYTPMSTYLAYDTVRSAFVAAGAVMYMSQRRVAHFYATMDTIIAAEKDSSESRDVGDSWSTSGARGLAVFLDAFRWLRAAARKAGTAVEDLDLVDAFGRSFALASGMPYEMLASPELIAASPAVLAAAFSDAPRHAPASGRTTWRTMPTGTAAERSTVDAHRYNLSIGI